MPCGCFGGHVPLLPPPPLGSALKTYSVSGDLDLIFDAIDLYIGHLLNQKIEFGDRDLILKFLKYVKLALKMRYLKNRWLDFCKTSIDISLG